MLKGGNDHNERKSCRIRINYFTEPSKMGFIQNILGSTESLPLKPTSSNLNLHDWYKTLLKDHNLRTSVLRKTRIAITTFMCSPCGYTCGLCFTPGSHVMLLPPNPFLLTLSMDGGLQANSCPELYVLFIVWWCSAGCLKFKDFPMVLITQLPQCITNIHSLGTTFS